MHCSLVLFREAWYSSAESSGRWKNLPSHRRSSREAGERCNVASSHSFRQLFIVSPRASESHGTPVSWNVFFGLFSRAWQQTRQRGEWLVLKIKGIMTQIYIFYNTHSTKYECELHLKNKEGTISDNRKRQEVGKRILLNVKPVRGGACTTTGLR